eukprot:CAMPEP_0170513126 /NCGR_PEP_ID=MMETSP0208-20121228/67230_1 /TAXON_ID=197538 /ORGANISM="Strombidium inclinatum, Strain S3" /LENGTH=87 /DNA_ID=CAMNT_0010796825 /DNA_START=682 /DNA_END=945 /DNA_ORIENTATION=+
MVSLKKRISWFLLLGILVIVDNSTSTGILLSFFMVTDREMSLNVRLFHVCVIELPNEKSGSMTNLKGETRSLTFSLKLTGVSAVSSI